MQPTVTTDPEPDYDAAWNVFVGLILLGLMVGAFFVSALIGLNLVEAAIEIYG